MKQKLLNNFKLRATLLVAMLCAAFTGVRADVTDVLNYALTGVSGTSYSSWSGKTSNSDAVYAGQSAGGNSSIQLRSNNNNSGVITTTSGGTVKSISVTWNSNTQSGRTLNVYGKNSAYSAPTDLYNTSTQGDLLGTIVCGTSTELVVSGSYEYIGFRSANSAMYLDEVQITWTTSGGSSSAVSTTTVIDASNITNTDIFAGTEAGSLSATVVDEDDNAVSGATVTWSGNNNSVATIDANTGVVTLVSPGTVTFTATYAGVKDEYASSSDTYEMTVADSTPFTGGDVTFDATTDMGTSPLTKQAVTFECNNGALNNGSEYRLYKNSVTTFSLSNDAIADGFVIKSIVFTGTGSNPASGFSAQTGWTTDGNNGTWAGAATEVSFTASGAQVRATQIVVTVGQSAALASIALSGEYPTTFHVGDAFSSEGIVVTATYEDATNKVVTESATFTGFDMATAGVQEVTVSYTENEVTKTATYDITVNAPATLTSITLSGNYPTEFQQGGTFSSEGIIVTANFDDNTSSDVTALAEFSGYDLDELGQQTVTVTYGNQTAEYTITVVEQKGTAAHPYSVAEAVAFINTLGGATSGEVYVSGIVSQVDSYNSNYSSITYWISEDGTTTGQMEVYSGKGLGGAAFSAVTDLAVGDIVTVKGNVKMYGTTPEFDKNNELVSFERPATPTITLDYGYEYNVNADGGDNELPVTCDNMPDDPQLAVVFVESDGTTPATYNHDWITATINNEGNIAGHIDPNTGDARTAYFRVSGVDANNNTVYSELVTISQGAYTGPSITTSKSSLDFDAGSGERTFSIEYTGLGSNPSFDVQFFESDETTPTTCDWITSSFATNDNKVTITVAANTGDARTAYFKVYAEVNKTKIYSNLVTINQAAPVVDYATLPFSFNGGKGDIESQTGLTHTGLGTDYSDKTAPTTRLKFDSANDELVLKLNEAPTMLTFDIKGNGFSGGTFTVQTSSDGEKYSDLKTYTDLGDTQSESFNLDENVRYIKWIYTNKVNGNVGLGNIIVTAPITVTLNAYGYATFASEFALDFVDVEPAGFSAWAVSEISGETINFTQVTDQVEAGTGVLLKGEAGAIVTINRVASGMPVENLLVGITEETPVEADQYYGLKGNTFVPVNAGTAPAGKALLPASNVSLNVKAYTFIFNDADGIQSIQTVSAEEAQAIFNLAGQRLPKAQKGINIINGKKVLVK